MIKSGENNQIKHTDIASKNYFELTYKTKVL